MQHLSNVTFVFAQPPGKRKMRLHAIVAEAQVSLSHEVHDVGKKDSIHHQVEKLSNGAEVTNAVPSIAFKHVKARLSGR